MKITRVAWTSGKGERQQLPEMVIDLLNEGYEIKEIMCFDYHTQFKMENEYGEFKFYGTAQLVMTEEDAKRVSEACARRDRIGWDELVDDYYYDANEGYFEK